MNGTKQVLDSVLQVLRSRGAEGDAWLQEQRTLGLRLRDGRLESLERAESRGLAVRAMHQGRLGFCHTARADVEGAAEAAAKACDLARAASPRDDLLLAPAAGPGDGSDEGAALNRRDDSIERLTTEQRTEWMCHVETEARGLDPRIRRTDAVTWNEGIGGHWIANTNGLLRHCRWSFLGAGVSVIAEDKGEMQTGENSWEGVHFADLPDPEHFGRSAGERAVRLLGGTPVATGRYPVVFSPDAGWTLLVYLSLALNGDHLSRGRSWLAPLLQESGQPIIGSPLVTVKDEARHPQGPGRTPFDGEGVDTQDLTLLRDGKVMASLCDLAAGRRLGGGSTGSSNRDGYQALPGIGAHNLYLAPGAQTPEEIVAGVDRGLWIWGLSGWWIGLDPSNDRFSSAASGLWIEKGQPVRPVARVTVAGTLQEILCGVDRVGNDLVWNHGTKTPTFRVSEVAVSGV